MIHFPILRTRRLTVQLKELSIGESIALASIPVHMDEAACTAFLSKCVSTVKGEQDVSNWTVQERMLAVCHYLACVSGGNPDFELGEGHYSDYLDGGVDIQTPVIDLDVGELGGDAWKIRHLTGAMAEAIERTEGESDGISGRLHWLLGGMAAQLVRDGEVTPDASSGEFDEHLINRMKVISGYPESDFSDLMGKYQAGRERLHHLFRIEFSASGIVALPKGGGDLPPARFPVRSCLSGMALEMGR